MRFYKLGGEDGHTPVLVATFEQLHARLVAGEANAIEDMMGLVGEAVTSPIKAAELPDGRWVSTIFLAHAAGQSDPPRLFETMMFNDSGALLQRRYLTWDEAVADHDKIVADPDGAIAENRAKDRDLSRFFSALLTGKPIDDWLDKKDG